MCIRSFADETPNHVVSELDAVALLHTEKAVKPSAEHAIVRRDGAAGPRDSH
jgi:hypothetical protein